LSFDLWILSPLGLLAGVALNLIAGWLSPRGATCAYCGRRWDYGGAWAVVAYVQRQGTCAGCAASLPLRPVLVELICTVGLPLLWRREGVTLQAVFLAAYLFILLLLSVTDLEQRCLPNEVIFPALVLALIGAFVQPPGDWQSALWGGTVALAFFSLLYWLGLGFTILLRRRVPALGAGDVKLATFVGLVTGWPGVIVALGLGILAGTIAAVVLILERFRRGEYRPGQTMAYGPFLAIGAALALLLAA